MRQNRSIAIWLLLGCGMIFIMALLGAITRLTESGLSITDWAPATGALPPLNDTDWDQAFTSYQKIPQYKLLHRGMTLDEFKGIYFWEWLHRLWGRLIGVVLAVPLLYFLLQGQMTKALGARLIGIFALGGLQGFIGWFMVESGLEGRTSVSPYRLALHFGFAVLLYALLLWTALGLIDPRKGKRRWEVMPGMIFQGWMAMLLLALTMVWGAFTAGLHAGEAYNTWPLMGGEFFPSAALTIIPKWLNAFENLAFVQFIHRWLGPLTAVVILLWVFRLDGILNAESDRRWIFLLGGMAVMQVALGLTTLLTHVEIVAATCHQAGAILVFTLLLVNIWRLRQRA